MFSCVVVLLIRHQHTGTALVGVRVGRLDIHVAAAGAGQTQTALSGDRGRNWPRPTTSERRRLLFTPCTSAPGRHVPPPRHSSTALTTIGSTSRPSCHGGSRPPAVLPLAPCLQWIDASLDWWTRGGLRAVLVMLHECPGRCRTYTAAAISGQRLIKRVYFRLPSLTVFCCGLCVVIETWNRPSSIPVETSIFIS